jgi:2-polyprenyl-3-methyl-5-hydroxy-6-metoxy-1,4-benzoquinol methylase/peptidoglycan/xylan/chitin deacetylase (PgdA/CDA1 family)
VITISENSKADIARFYGYPAERIVVTPLAADEDFFRSRRGRELKEARGRYGLPERYVLAVNMGSPKKNVATLLGAWARLPEGLRAAFKLAVVGEWSPSSVDIPRLVKERGIEGSVAVTGYVPREDLFFLYAGATLFCFPSLHEGFGLPVLEAMASGVPVITSNAASLPEVAADAAVLLDPGDEAGWAAAMERLLGSEKERTRLAKEGRWRANQFRWEQTAEATLGVIDEVLKSSRRRGKGAGASAGRARVVSPRMTAPAGAGRRFEPVPLGGLALAVTVDDVRPEPGFGGGREKDPLGYLLRLHKEFGVKSTLFVPTNWQGKWPVEKHLDWLKWLLGQPCFEVACHGHLHAAGDGANAEFKGLSPERLEGVLAESLRVFGMAGHRPAGVKAPGWSLEPSAYEVFAGRFDYVADHVQGVEASCLAGAKLLRLPYLYTIDEMGAWPEKGLVVLQSHVAPEGATTNGWCEGLYERVRAFVRTGKRLGARFVTLGELARELKGALPETPRAPRPVPAAIVATASDPRLRGGEVKVLGAEAGVLYNASGAPCPLELKPGNAGIAILSRNRRGYLAELLKSIDETGPKELGRVVLLNNCEDDSAKHLADRFPNWRVVELNDRDYPDVPAGLVWLKEHCSGLLPGPVDKLGPAMGWTAPRSIGWLTNELFCRCGRDFLVKFDDDFVVKPGWWEYYVRFQREYGAHAVMNNFGAFAMCRTVPGMIGWVDERFLGSHGHEDNDYAARMMEGRVRWVLGFNREHDWRSAEEGNPRGSMTGADCFIHRYALAGGGYSARRDEAMRDPVRAAWNSRWFAAKWEETEEDTGVFARPPFKGKFLRRKVAEEPDWRPGGLPDAAPAAAGVKVSENTPVSEIDLVANPATGTMVDRYALLAHWCKGKRVLDAGCGYGYGSSILLALGAESVVGADADAAALAYAESHYAGPRISFKAYDLADGEPGALGWFGVVVSVETLEHLPREKAERYLAGLRAHAEPGGVVIVTTPRRAEAEWRYRGGTHRYEYSAGEFADLVAKAFPGAETSFMDIEEFRVQGEARLYSRLTPAIDDRTRVMVAVARGVR